MYDFYLGTTPQTLEEETRYLLSIKRMLPRWVNSIPDAEFMAIVKILHDLGIESEKSKRKLFLVETGVGASTLAFVFYAIKHKGLAYTWDFNTKKGSEIRTVCHETIGNSFEPNINRHWKLIGYHSLSPHLGISILKEWTDRVDFSLHDSEHVWTNVVGELKLIQPFLQDGSVVGLDDAYYDFSHTDTAFINIARKKLGLGPIAQLPDNKTEPHWMEVEKFLKQNWSQVTSKAEHYKSICREDVSIAYFNNELQVRTDLGMERVQQLESRFVAWEVRTRKSAQAKPTQSSPAKVAAGARKGR